MTTTTTQKSSSVKPSAAVKPEVTAADPKSATTTPAAPKAEKVKKPRAPKVQETLVSASGASLRIRAVGQPDGSFSFNVKHTEKTAEGKRKSVKGASAKLENVAEATKAVETAVAKAKELGWEPRAQRVVATKADAFSLDTLPKPSMAPRLAPASKK